MNESWKREAGLCYYSRRRADIYRPEVLTLPAASLTSSDQRIASFGTLEPSVSVVVQLTLALSQAAKLRHA